MTRGEVCGAGEAATGKRAREKEALNFHVTGLQRREFHRQRTLSEPCLLFSSNVRKLQEALEETIQKDERLGCLGGSVG